MQIARNVHQPLFDPVRDQPRIGAMRGDHRRPAVGIFRAQCLHIFAQAVVRAMRRGHRRIGIPAEPGLDAGIEIYRAFLVAKLDQCNARNIHRKIE